MGKKIYAIRKTPSDIIGHIVEIDNTLEALQEAVGGRIEVVRITSSVAVICDEEGRIKGRFHNCSIAGIEFVGTILAVGIKGEEFTDVPIGLDDWKWIWVR